MNSCLLELSLIDSYPASTLFSMETLYEGSSKKLDILLVEVIVPKVAAGSFSKRMGVKDGTHFKNPIVEFSDKSDELGERLINDDYAREMDLAALEESALLKK